MKKIDFSIKPLVGSGAVGLTIGAMFVLKTKDPTIVQAIGMPLAFFVAASLLAFVVYTFLPRNPDEKE